MALSVRQLLRVLWPPIILGVVAVFGYLCSVLRHRGAEIHVQAWMVGSLCLLITIPSSLYVITDHLENYSKPLIQRQIIRVLWMVPVYALNAWLSLTLGVLCIPEYVIYVDAIRECYESYTIYSFVQYLLAWLEDYYPDTSVEALLAAKLRMVHIFPLGSGGLPKWLSGPWNLLPEWEMGPKFLSNIKYGVLLYVVVRPCTVFITLVSASFDEYGPGDMDFLKTYPYVMLINNVAQCWAIYCLVLIYHELYDELQPMGPFWKFCAIKGVVFFTFWQSLLLSFMEANSWFIKQHRDWHCYTTTNVVDSSANFLLSMEMVLFGLLSVHCFPAKEYRDATLEPSTVGQRLRNMFFVKDVVQDVRHGELSNTPMPPGIKAIYRRMGASGMQEGLLEADRAPEGAADADSHPPGVQHLRTERNVAGAPSIGEGADDLT